MASKEEQYAKILSVLETLDCYLTTTNALENEVAQFKENPHREIAGFMSASSETIDVPKGFIRMLYCLSKMAMLIWINKGVRFRLVKS